MLQVTHFLFDFWVSVLLSAHVERFSVSCLQDSRVSDHNLEMIFFFNLHVCGFSSCEYDYICLKACICLFKNKLIFPNCWIWTKMYQYFWFLYKTVIKINLFNLQSTIKQVHSTVVYRFTAHYLVLTACLANKEGRCASQARHGETLLTGKDANRLILPCVVKGVDGGSVYNGASSTRVAPHQLD